VTGEAVGVERIGRRDRDVDALRGLANLEVENLPVAQQQCDNGVRV
jgi:hypothetical protein